MTKTFTGKGNRRQLMRALTIWASGQRDLEGEIQKNLVAVAEHLVVAVIADAETVVDLTLKLATGSSLSLSVKATPVTNG